MEVGGYCLVPGECLLPGGVSAPRRGCLLPGGAWSWGVPGPGGLGGGGIPACTEADPPVNRMTDRCKNITLPQTSFAGGKNEHPSRRFAPNIKCIHTPLYYLFVNLMTK